MNDTQERLSADDAALMQKALGGLREAQAVCAFVLRHFSEKYGLGSHDGISEDGAIQRVVPPMAFPDPIPFRPRAIPESPGEESAPS